MLRLPVVVAAWAISHAQTQDFPIRSFRLNQPVVATYFFYWYEAASYRNAQATRNFDPYPFHPPNIGRPFQLPRSRLV